MLNEIKLQLEQGKAKVVKELVAKALEEKMDPNQILNAMLDAMSVVGVKFKNNEVFVPEVLIAARALNMGLEIFKPALIKSGIEPIGKAVIGTIEGDLHNIGKNLVKMIIGAGLKKEYK